MCLLHVPPPCVRVHISLSPQVQEGQNQQMVISENLGAVLNDDGSVKSNANLSLGTHVFTFDYVYDQVLLTYLLT